MKRLLFAALLAAMPIYAQTTPNLKLNLPVFSRPGWAPLLNANFTSLDQYLSGAKPLPKITLSGPITSSTQAATKAYVDAAVTGGCGFCITALTGDVTASGGGSQTGTVRGINGVLLSSLANGILKVTAGVPSIATPGTDFLLPSHNLSDLTSASTARTNLGLGTAATQASSAFDAAGAAAAAQTAAQTFASNASNLTSGTIPSGRIPTLNQSTTGNAATASALAATPSLCSSGQAAGGILSNGNATQCFTPAGSGAGMVYPSGSGLAVVSGGTAWGTTLMPPTGAIIGTTDIQTMTNKTVDGVSPATFAFIDPTSSIQTQLNGKQASLGFTAVPTTTTVNGHDLSSNVVVSSSDLTTGTLPHAQLPTLISGDIPDNGASTTGTAANLSGTQTANFVYAAPNGSSGNGSFRALVAADIPALSYQAPITLTTIGTSGSATLVGNTLNVPQYTPGSGMVYPVGSGIPIVASGTSWGTTVAAPTGTIVGTTDTQTLSNKSIAASQLTGASLPNTFTSAGGLTTVAGGTFGTAAFTATSAYDAAGSASAAEAAFTGDVVKTAGSFATTVTRINGTSLAGLATGLLKNAITTGIPSIAVAGTDYQAPLSLTTTGISGAATLASNVLNVPNYSYTLPQATTSVLGGVMCDGTTISCASGVISAITGGAGTVTSVSSGNLSPLFTTSVATGTTTPVLSFALSNAAQNSVLAGPASGGAGSPSYQTAPTISAANMTSFPTLNQTTTGTAGGLTGGAVGSLPYQSAANTTAFIASPTTTGHTFVPAWQPSGSAIAPTSLDLATYLAAPPSMGSVTPGSGAFTTLTSTGPSELGNPNGNFSVDANSPSSCTVNSVAYTTAFDCALANAELWVATGGQQNATLRVGSNGVLLTNLGIQEPTAVNNHGTVNIIGSGVNSSTIKLNASLASGVCMFTQPPEATALNYATVTVNGLTLDANNDADCIMQINGAKNSTIEHVVGKNVRAGSGHIGFQIGPSNASTSTVFETFASDVKLDGTAGGYTPAIITCTVSSGNPVCTITDAGSYPTGTFSVQVHGVGNGSGPCSVYPTWVATGTTTLTGLTASGGTCVAPIYVSVTPAAKVDYNFLIGPGATDSTFKDLRAVESSLYAGIKVTGHPNTFIHPHCYVGQYACVEDYGSSDYYGLESDSIGGYAAVIEQTGSRFMGISQIYNNYQRYAGSSLLYVDQSAATNIGVTVSGVGCNGNRQNQGGYHNLVIGTGLPYTNTSSAGGASDAGYAVPAGVQMNDILDCSTSPTTNTVYSHIGSFSSIGAITSATDGTHAAALTLAGNTTLPTLPSNLAAIVGPSTAALTSYSWQMPSAINGSAGVLHVAAPSGTNATMSVSQVSLTADVTGALPAANLATAVRMRALGWSFGDLATGSALTTSEVGYITIPYACTITGWHIMVDSGTATVKVARVNGGTALPTIASNSISTSGVAISTGTKIDSTTVTDFTSTAIAANDTLGIFLTAASGPKQLTYQLDCQQ